MTGLSGIRQSRSNYATLVPRNEFAAETGSSSSLKLASRTGFDGQYMAFTVKSGTLFPFTGEDETEPGRFGWMGGEAAGTFICKGGDEPRSVDEPNVGMPMFAFSRLYV